MFNLIQVVIEDKENNRRIIVATCQKPISMLDSFPNDLAKELLKFLLENAGRPMGRQMTFQRNVNSSPVPQNKKPFEELVQKVYIE